MAQNVVSNADKPALMSGSGTPMTGSTPRAIPTFIKICNANAVAIDIMTSIAGLSFASRAPAIIRDNNNAYAKRSDMHPINPVFSAVTAKMKSV